MSTLHELINIMRMKQKNIKLHVAPEIFGEVVNALEEIQRTNTRLYSEMRRAEYLEKELAIERSKHEQSID